MDADSQDQGQRLDLDINPIEFSKLPAGTLQTGTLQAVMDQNEDLLARLHVQIKRSAQLESRIQKLASNNDLLVRQNDSLVDETAVAREKLKTIESLFLDASTQRDEIQNSLNEIYTRARATEAELRSVIDRSTRVISRHARYRSRIQKYVRPFVEGLVASRASNEQIANRLRAEHSEHRQVVSNLNLQIKKLEDALKQMETQFSTDLAQLTSKYEGDISQYQDELDLVKSQKTRILARSREFEKDVNELQEKLVLTENRAVHFERKYEETQNTLDRKDQDLSHQIRALHLDIQTRDFEISNLREIVERQGIQLQAALQAQKTDFDAYSKLKVLHDETLTSLLKISEREAASQRLNVELSQNLKEYRLDVERLSAQLARLQRDEEPSPSLVSNSIPEII